MSKLIHGRRSVLASLLFWVIALLSIVASSYLVRHGLYFDGVPPVPLRVNPLLLTLGLIAIPSFAGLAWLLWTTFPRHRYIVAISSLGGILLGCGAVFAAVHPGSGSLVARDEIRAPDQDPSRRIFAIPVFFENGSSRLTASERERLTDAFGVFASCGSGSVFVRGFASSLKYGRLNSDGLNAELANERAKAVQEYLAKRVGVHPQLADPWKDYPEMVAARRIRDVDLVGKRMLQMERLNRRVELFWDGSPCANDGVASK